jgi:hypothetical protein
MPDTAPGGGARRAQPAPRWRRPAVAVLAAVLLAAATFLVGLLIGAGLGGAPGADRDAEPVGAAPSPPATGEPGDGTDSPDRTVTATVPDECLAAVAEAERSAVLVEEALTAARELDLVGLQQAVEELRTGYERARALADECQAQAEVSFGTTEAAPPS